MKDWAIRLADTADVPALVELRLEFMRIIKDGGLPDEADWRRHLTSYFSRGLSTGKILAWIGFIDDRAVATAALRLDRVRRSDPSIYDGYIMSVYTAPEFRGQGLASALLSELAQVAIQKNLPRLILHPTPSAVEFYQRRGFAPYRTIMSLKREGFHELLDRSLHSGRL